MNQGGGKALAGITNTLFQVGGKKKKAADL